MDYFSAEKNKDFRIILAANFESLADTVKDRINHTSLDFFFLEFLRGFTDMFNNKSYTTKNHTNHNIRGLIQNEEIVVVKGDKVSTKPEN